MLWLLIFSTGIQCQQIHKANNPKNTGGIYGKVGAQERQGQFLIQSESLSQAIVSIEGTDLSTNVDSSGNFYFPRVKPGKYRSVATVPQFSRSIVEGIKVSVDSISIVEHPTIYREI